MTNPAQFSTSSSAPRPLVGEAGGHITALGTALGTAHGAADGTAHALTTDAVAKLVSIREFPPKGPGVRESWESLTELVPDLKQRFTYHLVTDPDIGILADQCPGLNQLNLAGHYLISDGALPYITHLTALQSLNLASTQVNNLSPLIDRLPALTEANFFNTRLEPEAFQQFLARTHLRTCTLPESVPSEIFSVMPLDSLEEVSLIIGSSLPFKDLLDLLAKASRLRSICLQIRTPVTSEQLEVFVSLSTRLKKIDLLGDRAAIKPSLIKLWKTAIEDIRQKGIEFSTDSMENF